MRKVLSGFAGLALIATMMGCEAKLPAGTLERIEAAAARAEAAANKAEAAARSAADASARAEAAASKAEAIFAKKLYK